MNFFIRHPSAFILAFRQWLYGGFRIPYSCGAAGEFPPLPFPANFGFWIADFGFGAESKIRNLKSGAGKEKRKSPLSLTSVCGE
jgi:hypothetical protein